MSFFHVYMRTDCGYCKRTIELLEEKEEQFVVTVLDKSPEFERAVKQSFNQNTVPIIIEVADPSVQQSMRIIGGFDQLSAELSVAEAEVVGDATETDEEERKEE